eukprot:12409264-Karenia_brevis.AAC.1
MMRQEHGGHAWKGPELTWNLAFGIQICFNGRGKEMKPTLVRKTCAELGYKKFISNDPIFDFAMYALSPEVPNLAKFFSYHPLIVKIAFSWRDANPACNSKILTPTQILPMRHGFVNASVFQPRFAAEAVNPASIVSLYDASGTYRLCLDGPKKYMEECVMFSNWFAYLRMFEPTSSSESCTAMKFDRISTSTSFPRSNVYWKGGAAALNADAGSYFVLHPDLTSRLIRTKQQNPMCEALENELQYTEIVFF